ncbi:MAG: DUF3108 domain-containing protein [Aquimonas sp.]|jgi:hypothetical protein|nr:DUF3108 domain-containing protein [Xanthomonadales bacterium]MCC6504182.1 DUF3108 domain-containing protein [Aquimonas sp.]
MRGVIFWLGALMTGATPAATLEPFTAYYQVFEGGKAQGEASLQLSSAGPGQWRYDMNVRGTSGLARMAGFEMQQSTLLREDGDRLIALSAHSEGGVVFKRKVIETHFDWTRREVRWSGDVKSDQRGPVTLQEDSVSGQALNLLVSREAGAGIAAGVGLRYHLVERGKAKAVAYIARAEEVVDVPAGRFRAQPLTYNRGEGEHQKDTTVWISRELGIPTPVRVLQREEGEDAFEMRLVRVEQR